MSRSSIAAFGALVFLAAAPMAPSSGFQATETFAHVRVVVPHGTTTGGAAIGFCTARGFSSASAYDLESLLQPTAGTAGMAVFTSVGCRTYLPTGSAGGALVTP